jgi:branched-chain amino acid transport system substrate-binding protein
MVFKRKRKFLSVVGVAAIAAISLGGCSSSGGSSGGGSSYNVTFIGPLSGTNADIGIRPADAIQVLFNQINDEGGVERPDGTHVTLSLSREDDLGTPQGQTLGIRKASRTADALIGGMTSSPTIAGMDVAQAEGIPYVIVGALSNTIEKKIVKQDMTYVFDSAGDATARANADMQALQDLQQGRDMYMVSQDTDFGHDMADNAAAYWKKHGGTVTVEYVPAGTTEYSSQLLKIKNASPDVIYAVLTGQEMFSFVDQKHSAGNKALVYSAGSTASSDLYITTAGADVANGTVTNSVWAPDLSGKIGQKFATAYEKFGKRGAPADIEAQAYDGALMLIDALKKAKTLSKSNVAAALVNAKVDGLRGVNQYDKTTHVTTGLTFLVSQIQDGKFVPVWPSKYAKGKLQK